MKKAGALVLCFTLLIISACGQSPDTDISSTSELVVQTPIAEPVTAEDLLSANGSYGESSAVGNISVRDESICYRTEDSYRLEPIAVRAALRMLQESLLEPDSLQVADCAVFNCADDGESTYYDLSFAVSYEVGSGERISSSRNYSVGVRKEDESTFDASKKIDEVLDAYSIFKSAERNYVKDACEDEERFFTLAAEEIALSRLKNAGSGKTLSAEPHESASDSSTFAWDVLCEGENDFAMCVPGVYTVFLRYEDGRIVEVDPDVY